jgi:ABC-type multidrug transport system ATPase subunit
MVYVYFLILKNLAGNISGYLSTGERQMLGIGRALFAHPKIILLDEPSLGLALMLVKTIIEIIRKIKEIEKTLVSPVRQNARAALSVAEYGYVIENGRVVFAGPPAHLRQNEGYQRNLPGIIRYGGKDNLSGYQTLQTEKEVVVKESQATIRPREKVPSGRVPRSFNFSQQLPVFSLNDHRSRRYPVFSPSPDSYLLYVYFAFKGRAYAGGRHSGQKRRTLSRQNGNYPGRYQGYFFSI